MSIFKKVKNYFGDDPEDMEEEYVEEGATSRTEPAPKVPCRAKTEFVLVKPDKREDLAEIADNLLRGKTVILNLELVSKDTKRYVDFFSGVAYALGGQVKRVAGHTFLVIPGGVEISGEMFDDIEQEISY